MAKQNSSTVITGRPGRSTAQTKALQRVFNGLPVIDAKTPLRFFVSSADIQGADRKDPANCVIARACRRLFNSTTVLFWRSIAYVETIDENDKHQVERFVLNQITRRRIARFDRTGKADPAGYMLFPPAVSQQLDSARQYRKEWDATHPVARRRIHGRRIVLDARAEVRDGQGQIHFTKLKSRPRSRHAPQ
jgi:hypothetical protein